MTKSRSIFIGVICQLTFSSLSFAGLCTEWSAPQQVGSLDSQIKEASGVVASQQFENQIYHINDSGSKAEFFVTSTSGKLLEKVSIKDFNPRDTEDMSIGPCGTDSCLFIADTGDNYHLKTTSQVIAIKEKKTYGGAASIFATITFRYPDQKAYNVEAVDIHPNGDLVIITKDSPSGTDVPQVFWLSAAELWDASVAIKNLHRIGELDVAAILGDYSENSLVTSLNIHPSGNRFSVLTYQTMIEFNFDITKGINREVLPKDYTLVPTKKLVQQEAVTYLPLLDALIYTTEAKNAPMYQVNCLARK